MVGSSLQKINLGHNSKLNLSYGFLASNPNHLASHPPSKMSIALSVLRMVSFPVNYYFDKYYFQSNLGAVKMTRILFLTYVIIAFSFLMAIRLKIFTVVTPSITPSSQHNYDTHRSTPDKLKLLTDSILSDAFFSILFHVWTNKTAGLVSCAIFGLLNIFMLDVRLSAAWNEETPSSFLEF